MWDEANDTGHQALLVDLAVLVIETKDFQFHDFKNENYPAPKLTLVERFKELMQNTKNGKYDNEASQNRTTAE